MAALLIYALAAQVFGINPLSQDLSDRLSSPGWSSFMGTDQLGRDQFSRIGAAVRNSLVTAAVVILLSGVGGGVLGALSGYSGGKFDLLTQRLIDAVMALPLLVLALAAITAFGTAYWTVAFAISVAFTPLTLRVSRSSALALRNSDFVAASKINGASTPRIVLKHIAPNVIGPWSVVAASQAGAAVLVEAALGFLGLAPTERATLGGLLGGQAQTYMYSAPWLVIWPGIALAALALAFNLIGESLSERFIRLPHG